MKILGENLFPYLLQLLEATHISWFVTYLLHLQNEQCYIFVAILPLITASKDFLILRTDVIRLDPHG